MEIKELMVPHSTDTSDENDVSSVAVYTTDRMNLRVSKLFVC